MCSFLQQTSRRMVPVYSVVNNVSACSDCLEVLLDNAIVS